MAQRCTVPCDKLIGFIEPVGANNGKVFGFAAAAL